MLPEIPTGSKKFFIKSFLNKFIIKVAIKTKYAQIAIPNILWKMSPSLYDIVVSLTPITESNNALMEMELSIVGLESNMLENLKMV